ncbi:ATP-binding protein [Yinghuangia sp. ASG 101]|uniref:ATP-binding protein n=1 Tax=Yinghuangia sp. ASG 101 TaxID=2896848 RepID=UPI001E5A8EB7|nr:ATP-binding protein [Yinghuangia sp. ASG 101]UGQ13758.1 ATP-binding protein [Yinghuangia sp. ASG 101]
MRRTDETPFDPPLAPSPDIPLAPHTSCDKPIDLSYAALLLDPADAEPVFVRWTLPTTTAAVPELRHRVRDVLRGWGIDGDLRDTLLLVTTELASNAVRHTAMLTEYIHVTLALGADRIRLDIADGHPFRPKALTDSGTDAEDGRGLLIVKVAIAEAKGVIDVLPTAGGKTIRVRVPINPRA